MYLYEIQLTLAKSAPSITLLEKAEVLDCAIQDYNARTYQMQNPKRLEKISLSETVLTLRLESGLPLNSLGKALRTFSTIILKEYKDKDFIAQITPNGQLFAANKTAEIPIAKGSNKDINANQVDDLDALKALMDFIYQKKDLSSAAYKQKRAAMEKIKQIIIDSGIYTKDK